MTRGRSRMRSFRTYGSVRGAWGNSRPYRNRENAIVLIIMALITTSIVTLGYALLSRAAWLAY